MATPVRVAFDPSPAPLAPPRQPPVLGSSLPPKALARSALTGVLVGTIAIIAPLSVRLCFGSISSSYFLANLASLTITLVVGVASIVVASRTALARGASLRLAGALGLLTSIPVMIASNLALLALQRAYPAFEMLDRTEPQTVEFYVLAALADAVPLLTVWSGLIFLPAMLRAHDERQRELDAARRDAELLRLRSHLEPHFVLNTMNAIAGLVTEDPVQARELLGMLGDVFRDAASSEPAHTVDAELAWLSRFVAIHLMRFPDQLEVSWQVDPRARACAVPALILQPLAENALVHGALRAPHGRLAVRVECEGGELVLEVRDNGPGLGPRRVGGKGLALVERRLTLEGAPWRLWLGREGAETVARVYAPLGPPVASPGAVAP